MEGNETTLQTMSPANDPASRAQVWAQEAAARIRGKMAWVSEKSRDKIPYTTD